MATDEMEATFVNLLTERQDAKRDHYGYYNRLLKMGYLLKTIGYLYVYSPLKWHKYHADASDGSSHKDRATFRRQEGFFHVVHRSTSAPPRRPFYPVL